MSKNDKKGKYIEAAPGQYLFTQEWEQQSFDCQAALLKDGKQSSRRMLSSVRQQPSKVNGAKPTPADAGETVWPHLISITVEEA